jgi:hypothetical protein
MEKYLKNAPLEKGDTVVCIKMQDDYGVPGGVPGVVTSVSKVMGDMQYNVNWDNGSKLALIEGVDKWMKVVQHDDSIDESFFITKGGIIKESKKASEKFNDLSDYYDIRLIKKFLDALRVSSVTNMYQAAQYLYLGKKRIAHEHHYNEFSDDREEAFNEVLDMAEDVRNEMIRGAFKSIDDRNQGNGNEEEDEDDRRYLRSVENKMKRDAQDLLTLWMELKGNASRLR